MYGLVNPGRGQCVGFISCLCVATVKYTDNSLRALSERFVLQVMY